MDAHYSRLQENDESRLQMNDHDEKVEDHIMGEAHHSPGSEHPQ
jgi:hypothetical protein